MFHSSDTIVAQATAQGRAGIGIVRISGSNALPIARRILKCDLIPRVATYQPFFDEHNAIIDQGIALYFPNPNSFTGEDVLELQGHGSVVVLDLLMKHILATGLARLAQPGEFSQRAFLNDKLDLAQAEAIADLINASSEQAVRSAIRTLQGHFSQTINQLWDTLVALRVYVEAAIDFPDEEIDFLSNGHVQGRLETLLDQIVQVEAKTKQGTLIRDGMTLVIAGKPNAGKSSLLNALAGRERAIVTDIAGTTRDTLTEYIHLDGMPLHLIDTAGLRETDDIVEKIGVQRAWEAIRGADQVLLIVDSTQEKDIDPNKLWPEFTKQLPAHVGLTLVRNKIDLLEDTTHTQTTPPHVIAVSAKTGEGLATLTESLKACMGYQPSNEGQFIARRRHLQALNQAKQHIQAAQQQLLGYQAGELVAEELRIAADCLGEITGKMNADELLGEIFSNFCIGK